ncbi:MAG: hypothetical protein B7Y83_17535, partial [Flavobacteriales bacterium 32-34-25]
GVVRQREITIGATLENLFEVKKGLNVNDHILLDGLRLVKNNEKVKFNVENPKKVFSTLDVYAE